MQHSTQDYLAELGIETWQLVQPENLEGYQAQPVSLDQDCKLLLVADSLPQGEDAKLFENILKTMQLRLVDARFVATSNFTNITSDGLQWLWFAGSTPVTNDKLSPSVKTLTSVGLAQMQQNSNFKRDLWQQIQSLR